MAYHADELIYAGETYEDLASFEAAYEGVDISATDGVRARIRGATTDSGNVYFADWQAGQDADCKIVITAETGYGIQDRSSWTGGDGSGDNAIITQRIYVYDDSQPICMDIHNIEMSAAIPATGDAANNIFRAWNCLIRDTGTHGISFSSVGTTTFFLANLLIRDWSTSSWQLGIYVNDSDVTAYIWNCTLYTGEWGIYENAGSAEVRNCVAANTDQNAFQSMSDEDYCAADDASPGGANSTDNITVADNFTNAGADDFTVKDTGANIYHDGTDQPAWFDTLTSGNDIVGNAWHATTPSIGCFEYAAAEPGGLSIPVAMHHYTKNIGGG